MTNCSGKTFRVILALGLTFFAGMASPQDKKIVLRVADHFPHNHFMVEPLVKYWMNAVTKESGGTVAFEYFPAGQLGKATDMLSIALSGVADIAAVVPSNISDKFPLSGAIGRAHPLRPPRGGGHQRERRGGDHRVAADHPRPQRAQQLVTA